MCSDSVETGVGAREADISSVSVMQGGESYWVLLYNTGPTITILMPCEG